ncbi:Transport protein particle subunit trs23 [Grifola frondosa]|uniref:Trafficking protein particle complex subunit n=1 Tax=Grifola frondosa TaxID=5627 RepID=A0A1C7LM04_GRIFR|nr:Transport protein particle subunit trs23 [Grifola frondosa]
MITFSYGHFGLWVINKAGGLVYQRNVGDGLPNLTSNEYLVLAERFTLGAHVISGETFKMTILLTATGTKFVLLTSLVEPTAESVLQKVYEVYADAVMKNPFHTPEMPIGVKGLILALLRYLYEGDMLLASYVMFSK